MYEMCERSLSGMGADILETRCAHVHKLVCSLCTCAQAHLLEISLEIITLHANCDRDPLACGTGAVHFEFFFFNYSAITQWNYSLFW